jgi:hypothetical protein
MKVMTINAHVNINDRRYLVLRPNFQNRNNDRRAVIASTKGYLGEIFSWQSLHLPLKTR